MVKSWFRAGFGAAMGYAAALVVLDAVKDILHLCGKKLDSQKEPETQNTEAEETEKKTVYSKTECGFTAQL